MLWDLLFTQITLFRFMHIWACFCNSFTYTVISFFIVKKLLSTLLNWALKLFLVLLLHMCCCEYPCACFLVLMKKFL